MTDVARESEPAELGAGADIAAQRVRGRARRNRYLPSAQVLTELASLGPDLLRLGEDLRVRLTDAASS